MKSVEAFLRERPKEPIHGLLGAIVLGAVVGAVALRSKTSAAQTSEERAPEPGAPGSAPRPFRGDPHDGDHTMAPDGRVVAHRTPPGPRYEAEVLAPAGQGDRARWLRDVVGRLEELGLSRASAVLFAAHVARETGYGRHLYGHNPGNVKQFGDGPWHRLPDGEPYITYPTPEAGLSANLALLDRARYAEARRLLLAGDPSWYGALGLAGYYEGPPDPSTGRRGPVTAANVRVPQADYEGTLARVVAALSG